MKQFLIGVFSLLILTGVAQAEIPRPSEVADCANPEGYEYVCYDEDECLEYMKGYGGIVSNRFYMQKNKGWYPGVKVMTVPINLFNDAEGLYFIGKIAAELVGGKIYMKMWLNICDLEFNVVHEAYTEGFKGQKPRRSKVWQTK
ncbi:MAG: hypothetical protein ACW99G_05145 [Candidatus Thorarchaeota archaeon]|jgi:hypothetical protein